MANLDAVARTIAVQESVGLAHRHYPAAMNRWSHASLEIPTEWLSK